jgi:hypothetical protein
VTWVTAGALLAAVALLACYIPGQLVREVDAIAALRYE